MSKKISDLPAVVTPALTDAHEVAQGGVSKKETNDQILEGVNSKIFDHLYLAPLGVPPLTVQIEGQSGEATFTGAVNIANKFVFFIDGSGLQTTEAILVNGLTSLYANGSVGVGADLSVVGQVIVNGLTYLTPDGAASFANGTVTIGPGGITNIGSSIVFDVTGAASFAGNNVIIGADANISTIAGIHAQETIRADIAFNLNGNDGITADVVVGIQTLHFEGGILTSVT